MKTNAYDATLATPRPEAARREAAEVTPAPPKETVRPKEGVAPAASAPLLATASSLTFRATTRDRSGSTLGILVDGTGTQHHLSVDPEHGWALTGALPIGRKPVLLYESAANVLRGGQLGADGNISYQGESYVIKSWFDGNAWTAKVSGSV